jgi:hypothetical protein
MKKYIKQIAAFAFIVTLASCSADDNMELGTTGGNAVPTTSSISRLDNNYNLPLNTYTKAGVTVSKVEIFKNTAKTTSEPIVFGAKVADATLSEGKATFNTSTLGSFDNFPVTKDGVTTLTGKTGTFALAVLATYSDGTTSQAQFNLAVGKGITWQGYDDEGHLVNTTSSGVSSILYKDPTPALIYIAPIKKSTTTVTSIVGYWSKNDSGTFAALPLTLTNGAQPIDLAKISYDTYGGGLVAGDKITYKFIITAGTQTDEISTTVTFDNQEFGSSNEGSISNTASTFSFATGDNSASEITFVSPFGFKASTDVTIDFVESTLDFETADLFAADAAYAAGTKVVSLSNLDAGDVVLYKITRNKVATYGLIEVTDKVQGTTSQELKFSYKEGVLHK